MTASVSMWKGCAIQTERSLYVSTLTQSSDRPLALIISQRSATQMSSRGRKKASTDDIKGRLGPLRHDLAVGESQAVILTLQNLNFSHPPQYS